MDMDLYNILTQAGQSARVPEAGSAFAAALDSAAAREAMLQLKHREEHNAALDDLANQGMFEHYLTKGTSAIDGSRPRELGTGALRDTNTLRGGVGADGRSGGPPTSGSDSPGDSMEGEDANLPLLQSAFAKMEREGTSQPGEGQPRNGGEMSVGARSTPEKLASRSVSRTPPSIQKPGGGYEARRTAEGRKNAQSIREKVYGAETNEDRLRVGKEYGARDSELRAATALTIQSMRDAAALARQRAKGPGKTDDPIKWVEKGLADSQRSLSAIQKHYDGLVAAGFTNTPEAAQARSALDVAQNEADAWSERYKSAVNSPRGSRERGAAPGPRGEKVTPTGNIKTDKNGTVWEEMSDGSARKKTS